MKPMPTTLTPISPETATLLNKALAALAIAAFLAAAATILPSFQPTTSANAAPAPIKAERIANADPVCAEQNWPNFNPSCLKRVDTNSAVKQVRTVSTDKL